MGETPELVRLVGELNVGVLHLGGCFGGFGFDDEVVGWRLVLASAEDVLLKDGLVLT